MNKFRLKLVFKETYGGGPFKLISMTGGNWKEETTRPVLFLLYYEEAEETVKLHYRPVFLGDNASFSAINQNRYVAERWGVWRAAGKRILSVEGEEFSEAQTQTYLKIAFRLASAEITYIHFDA